jgi:hypothetical protein
VVAEMFYGDRLGFLASGGGQYTLLLPYYYYPDIPCYSGVPATTSSLSYAIQNNNNSTTLEAFRSNSGLKMVLTWTIQLLSQSLTSF